MERDFNLAQFSRTVAMFAPDKDGFGSCAKGNCASPFPHDVERGEAKMGSTGMISRAHHQRDLGRHYCSVLA